MTPELFRVRGEPWVSPWAAPGAVRPNGGFAVQVTPAVTFPSPTATVDGWVASTDPDNPPHPSGSVSLALEILILRFFTPR